MATRFPPSTPTRERRHLIAVVIGAAAFSALVGYGISLLDGGTRPPAPGASAPPPTFVAPTSDNSGTDGVASCSVPDGSTLAKLSVSSLMTSTQRVGGGEINDTTWSLWSLPSAIGAINSGGMVINGQAYALCLESTIPPASQINVDGAVITYHVIGDPTWPTLQVTVGPLSGFSAGIPQANEGSDATATRASICLTTPDASTCAFSTFR